MRTFLGREMRFGSSGGSRILAHIGILWTIGIILVVIGLILYVLGMAGRAVGGRKHYY